MDWKDEAHTANLTYYLTIGGSVAFFALFALGLYTWRINTFPHTEAVLIDVWDEWRTHRKTGERFQVTLAKLKFQRNHKGINYDCEVVRQLGHPGDGLKVGQKLEVVPATGTCDRIDIIGPVGSAPAKKPPPSREHWPSYLR